MKTNREKAMLVADSGSTKTDWVMLDETGRKSFQTQGLNPVLMSEEAMMDILRCELLPELPDGVAFELFFYGAGVREDQVEKMRRAFQRAFAAGNPLSEIISPLPFREGVGGGAFHFYSDLLGAARALCGHSEGIACILGTGSNSCLFDGEKIVQNTPALGYVLGDEGGGASLGKIFLNAIFKGLLPTALRDEFLAETGSTLDEIIRKVYREPMPNRFLASFSEFIRRHLEEEALRNLVKEEFRRFFRHNIVAYDRRDLPVGFVGSVALHFEPLLREAARDEGFEVGIVVGNPVGLLSEYHLKRR